MICMQVAKQNRASRAKWPTTGAPVHLRALATIPENGLAFDTDEASRERTARQGHHASVAEKTDVDQTIFPPAGHPRDSVRRGLCGSLLVVRADDAGALELGASVLRLTNCFGR